MVRATPAIRTAFRPVARVQRTQVRFRTTDAPGTSARDNGPVKEFNKTGNTNKPWLYVDNPLLSLSTSLSFYCVVRLKLTDRLLHTATPASPPSLSAASTPP